MPDSTPSPESLAAEIGERLLGQCPLVSRFQAEHSSVFRLDFGRDKPSRVLKLQKQHPDSLLREQHVILELRALGFEVPPIEFTQADCPDLGVVFTVMPLIRGTSVAALYSQTVRGGSAAFQRLGRFLGRLAELDPHAVPSALTVQESHDLELAAWDDRFRAFSESRWGQQADFISFYHAARALMQQPPTQFGARDGGQLITDGASTFIVIDWGEAGFSWPYAELARYVHRMKASHELRGGHWLGFLLRGFAEHQPLPEGWIETTETWLLYHCLNEGILLTRTGRRHGGERLLKLARNMVDRRWMEGT